MYMYIDIFTGVSSASERIHAIFCDEALVRDEYYAYSYMHIHAYVNTYIHIYICTGVSSASERVDALFCDEGALKAGNDCSK